MKKRLIGTLLAMTLLLSACSGQAAVSTTTTIAPATEATTVATTTAPTTVPTTTATTTVPTTTAAPTTVATTAPSLAIPGKVMTFESDAAKVTLTLPKVIFDLMGIDPKDLMSEAYAQGVSSAKVNPDGSLTYTMNKTEYQELLSQIKAMADDLIKELTSDKNTAFSSIKYNAKMTEFSVRVDRKKLSSSDRMAIMALQMPSMIYQMYRGVDLKDIVVTINFIDKATGKVFDSSGPLSVVPQLSAGPVA